MWRARAGAAEAVYNWNQPDRKMCLERTKDKLCMCQKDRCTLQSDTIKIE